MKTQRKWLMTLAACSLGVLSSAQTNYDFSKLQRENSEEELSPSERMHKK